MRRLDRKRVRPYLYTKAGFTVVEVIVVVGLITLVVAAGIAPYLTQQDMLKKQFARTKLQDEVSIVMSYIFKDIRRAREIITSASAPQLTFSLNTDPADPTLRHTQRINVTYSFASGNITRTVVGTGDVRTIASDITAFSISPIPNPIKGNEIIVTVTGQKAGQTISLESAMASRAISLS